MVLREDHPDDADARCGRLNLLLSCRSRAGLEPSIDQLADLLEPLGIASFRAGSGDEAADVIRRTEIHIAVVDLSIPLTGESPGAKPAGGRILQLLRRLDPAPPTVLVRPRQPAARESARSLSEALRDGAFAVVDRPINLETMLEVMRRVVRRHYADHWPAA
ncbi:MAG: hypothetical protein HKO59_17170 [Phycisphaerales bacterium]|nr:hypothetical protein [Phycisphaerae bacterium]NNF44013.1 hypothetical protein [Phycisphaerales bacterium]NNM27682.1 hypothetical protein [Phycisphaerales bacterium]